MENYKQLLKDYMIIECKNGEHYLVNNNRLISPDYHVVCTLNVFNNELKHIITSRCDVKRIYSVPGNDEDVFLFDLNNRLVYWERPEPKETYECTLRKELEKYETKSQIIETAAELSELSQALYKALISLDDSEKISEIVEKMEDVEIMLSQCRIMLIEKMK